MNRQQKPTLADLAAAAFASAETIQTWMVKIRQLQHTLEEMGEDLTEAVNGCDEAVNRMNAVYDTVLDLSISLTKIVKWRSQLRHGSPESDPAA